jgi:drug/metabolite transporter (DMT)-like permease
MRIRKSIGRAMALYRACPPANRFCGLSVLSFSLPFVFAVLWASSYTAAKIGLADISPYLFVAVRLSLASVGAIALVLALGRSFMPLRARCPHLVVGGALVHGLALSTAHAALVTVDATPTALVHAFHPILTAALGVALLGEKFAWWQWTGFALGLAGVVLGVPLGAPPGTLLLLALSLFGLTAGTLYLRRFCPDTPPFEATAVQLVGGALLSVSLAAVLETPRVEWTAGLVGAMTWNVAVMSVFGMAIYNLMLERHGAGKAASGFFVVPGASALIAWLLLGEQLPPLAFLGLAASTLGVALVWWKPRAPGA